MIIKLFLCALFSVGIAGTAFGASRDGTFFSSEAVQTVKPEMIVELDEGKPVYIHSRKKFDCSGGTHNNGCTRVVFFATIKNVKLTAAGGIRELTLLVGLRNVEIELSSELEKGSCQFDAVLKHELTHLALHRRILKRFAEETAKGVLALVESFPPPVTQAQFDRINKVLSGFVSRMMNEDRKQNALMDSQEAYRHLSMQCRE